MTEQEAAVRFYFNLTVGALFFIVMAALIASVVFSARSAAKASRHLDRILALPREKVQVWVSVFEAEYDLGTYPECTLYYQVEGEDAVTLTGNHSHVASVCHELAAAGRPVPTAPKWLVEA